jgi:hypothetical protein
MGKSPKISHSFQNLKKLKEIERIMAATDIFTLDEYINHVKVSGSLTEENREYVDIRDLQVIIDLAKREDGRKEIELTGRPS